MKASAIARTLSLPGFDFAPPVVDVATATRDQSRVVARSARFSACRRYRYLLSRAWGPGSRRVLFVLKNPSVASDEKDDPTVTALIDFAGRWECDALDVVNLFAWIATSPSDMLAEHRSRRDIVGPDTDTTIVHAARAAERIVLGWGRINGRREERELFETRAKSVLALLRREAPATPLECLRINDDGSPQHPLFLARATTPRPFTFEGDL